MESLGGLTDGATGAATPHAAEAVFALPVGTVWMLRGSEHLVERALPDGHWQFLRKRDSRPVFESNAGLATAMASGDFHLAHEPRLKMKLSSSPSPIATGPDAHDSNLRKHAYVTACLEARPGGKRARSQLVPIIRRIAEERGEKPPGFTTVVGWIDEHHRYHGGYGTAAYCDRHDRKGSRRS